MAGVDSTGFVQKTITEIIVSIQDGYRLVYGAGVNVASSSRIGQRIALFAGALAEVWELGEAVFNSLDPDASTGLGLDNVLKLNGLTRKPATSSTVVLTLTGVPTTVVAAGKRAQVLGSTSKFTVGGGTIAAVSAWVAGPYSVGDRAHRLGNVYQVTTGGVSAGGPSGTGGGIVDAGGVVWRFLGVGTGAVDCGGIATVTGPIQGFAFSITVIDTPVSGWNGVINLLDAAVGSDTESDSAARARRELSFAEAASSPLESIRAEVLAVAGVTSCAVFENFTNATVDGIPSKAFECVVEGGVDQDIIDAIGRTRPGGIEAYGTTSGTFNDSAGNAHTIKFSRPVAVNIWVKVTLKYDPKLYVGDTTVKQKLATLENLKPVGKDVVSSSISAGVFAGDVANGYEPAPGIFDVSQVLIGTSNPPVASTTIVVTPRQRAAFDTSRIEVVSSEGSF